MAKSKKVFVIDVAKCNGCHNCQIVCKDEHVANDWTPIAKPQPEIGQFWIELTERVRGTVPKVKVAYRPHLCMHCDQAPCLEACPVEGCITMRAAGRAIPAVAVGAGSVLVMIGAWLLALQAGLWEQRVPLAMMQRFYRMFLE